MKIYSFEAITSIEDVRQIPSYVPLGEQSILIPPSFPWIKDKLQDIAISLYNFDWEKLPTLIDALKTKTFEFTSQLTGATENSPATISIIENLFQSLHSFVNRPLNQIKDKELLSFTERLSGLIIYSYFKTLKVNVSLLDPSLFVCIGSNSKIDSEKSAECLRTLIQDQDAIVSILPARMPRRDDTDARKAPYALCDPHGNLVPCRGTYILYHETNVFGFTRRRRMQSVQRLYHHI